MTRKHDAFFFLFGFVLFLWILSVKPPFSSPDEGFHLSRADGLLQGYFTLKPIAADGSSGAEVDSSLDKMAVLFNTTLSKLRQGELQQSVKEMKSLSWSGQYVERGMPNVSFYTPSVYIPQALGFALGKIFGTDVYISYQIANSLTFCVCLLLLITAYRIYPIPALTLAMLLLPMSLFQIFSPTIDGLSMSFTVLSMSCFMFLLTKRNTHYYTLLSVIMSLCIFSAAGSRANLLLMSFMPLWLYYKNRNKTDLFLFFITIAATFSWTIFNLINVHDSGMGRHPGYTNFELVIYYLKHPFIFFSIFINTIMDVTTLDFYIKSMIGLLGWLDAPVSTYAFIIFSAVIVSSAIISFFSKNTIGRDNSIFIIILASLSLLLIFPALLAQWNPFPTKNIIGVQGRYFIIPALILGYAFNTRTFFKTHLWIFIIIIGTASTYFVYDAIMRHYYNSAFTYFTSEGVDADKFARPVNLSSSAGTDFVIDVPNGTLQKIHVYMGNYNNTADGSVELKACTQSTCKTTLLTTKNHADNSYYEFNFPPGIDIKDSKINLTFHYYKNKGDNPVALWEYSQSGENGSYKPRLAIEYSK